MTAAAIAGSCLLKFCGQSKIMKVLFGIFVTFTVVRPFTSFEITKILPDLGYFNASSEYVVSSALDDSELKLKQIIKENCETYIYDKAVSLGCEIDAIVYLSDEEPYQPIKTIISGNISPYAKNKLKYYLENELGIAAEDQQWRH